MLLRIKRSRIIDLPTVMILISSKTMVDAICGVKNAKTFQFQFENYNLRNQENVTSQEFVDIKKVKIK